MSADIQGKSASAGLPEVGLWTPLDVEADGSVHNPVNFPAPKNPGSPNRFAQTD
jgi:hypothetical protein